MSIYLKRIILNTDLPIDMKHGCFKGKEFDIIDTGLNRGKKGGLSSLVYFIGIDGTECGAFPDEYFVVEE